MTRIWESRKDRQSDVGKPAPQPGAVILCRDVIRTMAEQQNRQREQ
ncbi:MAG: hypothetical protein HUJ73_05975 [Eubacterium sp.]|nr:hypothetical protein [Eubacterium sp.]